jgi:predicted RNase H-like nuclease
MSKVIMHVIGIDPAPGKESTICSPNGSTNDVFENVPATEIAGKIKTMTNGHGPFLICWDAPLTGPKLNGKRTFRPEKNYSQRGIEAFFNTAYKPGHDATRWGTNNVKGINVQPYCGCPHWTISRAAFGYPILGDFCTPQSRLKWQLQTQEAYSPSSAGKDIVEVHPALALWLMQPEDQRHRQDYTYKGNRTTAAERADARGRLFAGMKHFVRNDTEAKAMIDNISVEELNDDKLDSLTAWALGTLWTKNSGDVRLMGDEVNGTFLLPTSRSDFAAMQSCFEQFSN